MQLLGKPLDLYGFIGLFLLLGLIKKNGIMLVDFAIMRRREGMNVEAAAVEAAIERLRPILMTTFAAIFGALPMAMAFGADGASRQPMGLCIVGGLAVAQILTFFCTPVFYIHMEYFQERYLDKVAFFKRSEGEFKQGGSGTRLKGAFLGHSTLCVAATAAGAIYWPVKSGRPIIRSPASTWFLANQPWLISRA